MFLTHAAGYPIAPIKDRFESSSTPTTNPPRLPQFSPFAASAE